MHNPSIAASRGIILCVAILIVESLGFPWSTTDVSHHHQARRLSSSPWCSSTRFIADLRNVRRTPSVRFVTEIRSSVLNEDDENLLRNVSRSMLQDIAKQQGLSSSGTKADILARLRVYVADEAAKDDSSSDNGGGDGYFYYTTPDPVVNATTNKGGRYEKNGGLALRSDDEVDIKDGPVVGNLPITDNVFVNENGERVVTVFSTTEEADLTKTGPHSRPGGMDAAAANFADISSIQGTSSAGLTAADTIRSSDRMEQDVVTSRKSKEEIESAKSKCKELLNLLLDGTAPGFSDPTNSMDDLSFTTEMFRPFNPSTVKSELLSKYSPFLRIEKGQVLHEVLREIEIEAVGHDGMAADDTSKGGGHYRQVQRVGTFLKGYRIAESRRVARDTASFLLNTVAGEGAKGLDFAFGTMQRGDSDGELNDDLIEYLEEAVAAQKRVVMKQEASRGADHYQMKRHGEVLNGDINTENGDDSTTILQDMDVETIDINNKQTRDAILELDATSSRQKAQTQEMNPSEQLLLLLQSLLDRVKAEAAFRADEHGKNLRLLAACLKIKNGSDRFQILEADLSGSLTRADEFAELIGDAITYAESTSTKITPGKEKLNVANLRDIQREVANIKALQAMKASGLKQGSNLSPFQ